ncbi:hypothetical protein AMTRI_Chr09g41930 [Amborella trichopoda]|uniref:EF-hand domain-containing protein n=1 Tax=Amborella trichopoda TaxID=13333 RepID=W1PTJ2_AMBTC|nr:calcium-binding protein KIC [Amborella trichopoda]ERN13342.1 hypothetical protein AMTR_s00041p00111770 [Amborella trichopoda]|eukprot:XP_006851875.1 calcium-binding protein KIC [Amborella trichopoda]
MAKTGDKTAKNGHNQPMEYEDLLPIMAEKLEADAFMAELCNGFKLLADPVQGLITFESLKKNSALLGLDGLSDKELMGMVREGDTDGDGALNEQEFCVLMVRLSPDLMREAQGLLEEALIHEIQGVMES